MSRDVMEYDVLIVGAGPAGLAAAIRLKQLAENAGRELSVCVLEKAAEVGAHILSGAVIDPKALNELLPDWRERGAPLKVQAQRDKMLWLSREHSFSIPSWLLPPLMKNHGCYIASLGALTRWLGEQAEALGVEIYPGFAAAEPIIEQGVLKGIVSGDMGRLADGSEGPQFAAGIEIRAPYTLIAEGTRGSLTRQLEEQLGLRDAHTPQKYAIGFKEVWRVKPELHREGLVQHTLGWPLANDVGGGSFLYHADQHTVLLGLVVHLDYSNPYLSPFDEFQRFKQHPAIRTLLAGGERLAYGARALNEGGIQSWPQLAFAGGALIGCAAGMINVPRIKGSHNAMKSGMLGAEAVFAALQNGRAHDTLADYPQALRASWLGQELDGVRNIKPMLSRFGSLLGTLAAGAELWLGQLGLRLPWTLRHSRADHQSLRPAHECEPIAYPKPDGVVSFDRASSIYLSNIAHDADQPCHLRLSDAQVPVAYNLERYAAPETRYCPAGVYEIVGEKAEPRLQINAQNCIHCKTCDIKDPLQNIVWVPPEGGSGPAYPNL